MHFITKTTDHYSLLCRMVIVYFLNASDSGTDVDQDNWSYFIHLSCAKLNL